MKISCLRVRLKRLQELKSTSALLLNCSRHLKVQSGNNCAVNNNIVNSFCARVQWLPRERVYVYAEQYCERMEVPKEREPPSRQQLTRGMLSQWTHQPSLYSLISWPTVVITRDGQQQQHMFVIVLTLHHVTCVCIIYISGGEAKSACISCSWHNQL